MSSLYVNIVSFPISRLLIFGVILLIFHLIYPCNYSIFLVLLWMLMIAINLWNKIYSSKISSIMFVFLVIICSFLIIFYYLVRNQSVYSFKCIGYFNYDIYAHYHYNYNLFYYDENQVCHNVSIVENQPNKENNVCFIIYVNGEDNQIVNQQPTSIDLEKYKYPVPCISKNIEVGNDSYEYAKYSPDIAYNSFGLNIVLTASTYDSSYISFYDLKNKIQYIGRNKSNLDTILVYSNINPEFYTGWHICPDSLCTSENYDKVLEGGYGYLFRGKIYSKEETEKYWNIIEQYKLRLNQ
ncbi:MAG: hypothetical protein IKQ46_03495 [Bacteroidales bacterium]|nr:hypothetical protein [Bacteroidales bacterium]